MTETARQLIFVVSQMMFVTGVIIIALASCEAKSIPRLFKAFAAVVALVMSALSFHALITNPHFGISLNYACVVVAGASIVALLVAVTASRRSSPAVN